MKIGLITFHKVTNLGAALQASALLKFLNDEDNQCEIIDFIPNNAIKHHENIVFTIIRKSKYLLKAIIDRPSYKRISNFNKFQKKHFILSYKTYYGDADIQKSPPKYDLLISGSDQIFNTTLSGDSSSYYLSFTNDTPKISYASSFGREELTETEYKLINSELPKFDFLSAREISAAHIIQKQIGRMPELVLDPVFLLDKSTWSSMAKIKNNNPFDKYIFVYFMEQSYALEKAVKELKKKTALPIVVVKGGGAIGPFFDFEDKTCGPAEFLRYILNAEYVITNSFHGTAMSLIFEKKFICVSHSSRNARLQNIMLLISADNKLIPYADYDDEIQNFVNEGEKLYAVLKNYIENSKNYITSALENYKE